MDDNVPKKRCTGPLCNGAEQPLTEFYVKDKKTGRLHARCKKCHTHITTEHISKNKDRYAAYQRKYRETDPTRSREAVKRHKNKNRAYPEEGKKYCTGCGLNQPNESFVFEDGSVGTQCEMCRKQSAEYRAKNAEKIEAYNAEWKRLNKDKVNASTQRRRARLANTPGSYTAEDWAAYRSICENRCLCCKKHESEFSEKLHFDHIIPLSKGGPLTIENSQPLCRSCNSKKGVKQIDYRTPEIIAKWEAYLDGEESIRST